MRLVVSNPRSGWGPVHHVVDGDREPCPTVMGQARGIGGQDWSHWWIEEDDVRVVSMSAGRWGTKGMGPTEDTRPAPTVTAGGVAGGNTYWLEGAPSSPEGGKPPYRVPSMAEVAELRGSNGRKVLSTFSGCGGSCLGFEMAGFEVVGALEFVEAARETYAANHPGVPILGLDVREVTVDALVRLTGCEPGELDVLEGSPPCASFSTAGKRHKGWGQVKAYSDTKQRADDLFFEFARLVAGMRPRTFVAENVSGLVKGAAKGYFKEILAALRAPGYRVEARLLDAQWLGVPQARQRLIFVGVRDDLDREPAFPAPLPYRYSLADALAWPAGARVDVVGHGWFDGGEVRTDQPAPTLPATVGGAGYSGHAISGAERIVWDDSYGRADVTDRPPPPTIRANRKGTLWVEAADDGTLRDPETGQRIDLGGTALDAAAAGLAEGEQSERFFQLVRSAPGDPVGTVTASGGGRGTAGVVHPQRRKFTLGELRRVCAFPDDFVLTGSYAQRWERLGRAVPPLMMRAVAEALRDRVLS